MTGEELGKAIEDYVNHTRSYTEVANYIVNNTHRTLNQSIIRMFVEVIKLEATASFDGRNEASVKLCKRLALDDVYLPYI